MKRLFALAMVIVSSMLAMAQQPTEMLFAGPSTFGVEAMNAWQENEQDTIVFKMNSTTEADITLPTLIYNAMKMTIPGFTIHNLKFDFDYSTHNAVFPEQTYAEVVVSKDGTEKTITGYSLTATYEAATQSFNLTTRLAYGKMPVQVTYKIDATYVKPTTAIQGIEIVPCSAATYDMMGRKVTTPRHGSIYLQNGKKYICK